MARGDFDALALNLKIPERSKENIYKRFSEKLKKTDRWVDISFLPEGVKKEYLQIMRHNAERIGLQLLSS